MDCALEVVIVPVSDVERAYEFYAGRLGFRVDSDFHPHEGFRAVQVTPPGSACSIVFGKGLGSTAAPGSLQGCHLVVADIVKAADELTSAGIENSGPQHFAEGVLTPGPDPRNADYGSFVFFSDPDGNSWAVQQVVTHAR
ncbi:VOC family protein [Pseudonocardia pini]|uniref:VOC family protein n=1 Tax=Pseudonocardia pini TaxID=2758030 RepID=UPI0015F0318A|nr:VOC family protein [Pseudonocardia pini]